MRREFFYQGFPARDINLYIFTFRAGFVDLWVLQEGDALRLEPDPTHPVPARDQALLQEGGGRGAGAQEPFLSLQDGRAAVQEPFHCSRVLLPYSSTVPHDGADPSVLPSPVLQATVPAPAPSLYQTKF